MPKWLKVQQHPNLEPIPWVVKNGGQFFFSQEGPGYFFVAFRGIGLQERTRLTELIAENGCYGVGQTFLDDQDRFTVCGLIGTFNEPLNVDAEKIGKVCSAAAKQINSHLMNMKNDE